MADLKFHCPECHQKIAVDESAAGMQVDCPNCRSTLIIPAADNALVEITVRRRLVSATGHADSAYEELERKHKELAAALQEAAKWRADTEQSRQEMIKLREDLEATARERDGLRRTGAELDRLKIEEDRFKTDLEKTREELASVRADREKLARELSSRPETPTGEATGLGPGHSVMQERLVAGEKERAELRAQLDGIGVADDDRAYNLTWHDWMNLANLIRVSQVITQAALAREDSRGAHFRADFPDTGDLPTSTYTVVRMHGDEIALSREPVRFTRVRPGESLLKAAA